LLKSLPLTGRKQAIIADFDKALGQNVLQEPADKLLGWQGPHLTLFAA
jgi:hypothetical protein